MPHQQIKFYQVGSFVAGNRLLRPDERSVQARMERSNTLTSGHRACQGCGEALGARYALDAAMRATGGQLVAANATGCLEVFSTPYPEASWQLPWLHSLFGNAPAVASGIAAGLKAKGRTDIRVVGQGGDGGTLDIGVYNCDGSFYAIEDRCSHDDGPLCEGDFEAADCVAVCPRHGSRFDVRTGRALTLPAYLPVDTFDVVVEDGVVKVVVP